MSKLAQWLADHAAELRDLAAKYDMTLEDFIVFMLDDALEAYKEGMLVKNGSD